MLAALYCYYCGGSGVQLENKASGEVRRVGRRVGALRVKFSRRWLPALLLLFPYHWQRRGGNHRITVSSACLEILPDPDLDPLRPHPPSCLVGFSQKLCLEGELRRATVVSGRRGRCWARGLVGTRPFRKASRPLLLEAGAYVIFLTLNVAHVGAA